MGILTIILLVLGYTGVITVGCAMIKDTCLSKGDK